MNKVRYIVGEENSTIEHNKVVCQLQYDQQFIQDIKDYEYGLSKINNTNGGDISLNIYGLLGVVIAFGMILNDNRQDGEFYEVESNEVFDGLPDETSFDEDIDITFNHMVVSPGWLEIIGYSSNGDEIRAEILIDDLNSFV